VRMRVLVYSIYSYMSAGCREVIRVFILFSSSSSCEGTASLTEEQTQPAVKKKKYLFYIDEI